jgi:putative DNA primase/helicase
VSNQTVASDFPTRLAGSSRGNNRQNPGPLPSGWATQLSGDPVARSLTRQRPPKSAVLDAALGYAARGWPVFPVSLMKRPLTAHGLLDATRDPELIRNWFTRWPGALTAIATGGPSRSVALDIDIRPRGSGFDTLDVLGISIHPVSPTTHTPRGGCAILFSWPDRYVKTVAGKLGPYLDIRADGGSLILPPGPGRFWDPLLGLDTAIAPMPAWLVIAEPEPPAMREKSRPARPQQLTRYAEAALDGAIKAIVNAPDGRQRDTLNCEVYSIARLVAGGAIPAGLAVEALQWAARQLRTYDQRRPWRAADLDRIVRSAFADGLGRPHQPEQVA